MSLSPVKTRLILFVASLLLAGGAVSAGASQETAGTFSILPFQNSQAPTERTDMGKTIASYLSILISHQTGWEVNRSSDGIWPAITWLDEDAPPPDKMRQLGRSLNSKAVIAGSYREQEGTLRIQADLYRPTDIGPEALRFNVSGRTGRLPEVLTDLSTAIGEAMEFRFLRRLHPPPAEPHRLPGFRDEALLRGPRSQ